MRIVYILLIQEFKKDIVVSQVKIFKRKFLGYYLCKLKYKIVEKIKHRKIEVIECETRIIKNNWYIRYK